MVLIYQIKKSTKKFAVGFNLGISKIYKKVCHWLQLSKLKNLPKSLLIVLTYQIEKSTKKFAVGFNLGNSKIYQKVCCWLQLRKFKNLPKCLPFAST